MQWGNWSWRLGGWRAWAVTRDRLRIPPPNSVFSFFSSEGEVGGATIYYPLCLPHSPSQAVFSGPEGLRFKSPLPLVACLHVIPTSSLTSLGLQGWPFYL